MTRTLPWALAAAIAALCALASCAGTQRPAQWEERNRLAQEILAHETNIIGWRKDLGLAPQPAPFLPSMPDPKFHYPRRELSEQCADVCDLARYICDAKDQICRIAGDLGDDDTWAKEKCQGARSSCREAQKRCDGCR